MSNERKSEITGEPLPMREVFRNDSVVLEPWPDSGNYSDPTPEMLENPIWLSIWEEIKHWDINVPSRYNGYMGATGNHATAIFKALSPSIQELVEAANSALTRLICTEDVALKDATENSILFTTRALNRGAINHLRSVLARVKAERS